MADKQRVANSFARHYSRYELAATVQRDMAERLDAALAAAATELQVRRALEIGIGTGFLTRLLTARFPDADWWFNDLSPAAFDWIPAGLQQTNTLPGDAEALPYPSSLDLLASASALQWFDDLPAFFPKAQSVLRPGGILSIATFGNQNFPELAQLYGRPLNYPSLPSLAGMAHGAGFQILATDEWQCQLRFPSARELLEHLRCTGVNAAASGRIRTPAQLQHFEETYRRTFGLPDASLPLTYHPLLLLARKERP